MFRKTLFVMGILILAGGLLAASRTNDASSNSNSYSGWVEGTRSIVDVQPVELSTPLLIEDYWGISGNSGTTPGTHFLGTTDNRALEIKVNNQRVFRFEPNTYAPNIIGGYSGNSIASGKYGSTIAGGGYQYGLNTIADHYSTISGGRNNSTDSSYSTVSGGQVNFAGGYGAVVGGGVANQANTRNCVIAGGYDNENNGKYSSIGGGYRNKTYGKYSRVGGGQYNTADSIFSTIGGGYSNLAKDRYATVGGGYDNSAEGEYTVVSGGYFCRARGNKSSVGGGSYSYALGDYSVVAGGSGNDALGSYSVVCGGVNNEATGSFSVVSGGYVCEASGSHAMVPGGHNNKASGYSSLAAGYKARANHGGSFVWADYQHGSEITTTENNQFIVRSSGGVWFGTNSSPSFPSGRFINTSTGAYLSSGGTWTNASDKNLKECFSPVDEKQILKKVAELPVTFWNYKSEDQSVTHIGPVAQDFNAAFNLGNDDHSISTVDANGVALVSIQALYKENQELKSQLENLQDRLDVLEQSQKEDKND